MDEINRQELDGISKKGSLPAQESDREREDQDTGNDDDDDEDEDDVVEEDPEEERIIEGRGLSD
jgi:hypothetical protein